MAAEGPGDELVVQLAAPDDWAGFRKATRILLAAGIRPGGVGWQTAGQVADDLFTQAGVVPTHTPETLAQALADTLASRQAHEAAPVRVHAQQLHQLEQACCHAEATRFALCHRWLYRVARRPGLREDVLDGDWRRIETMAKAVSREVHRMHAMVRFRPVPQADGTDGQVAWFEPEHHVLRAAAPFFVRRFANQCWSILTPTLCAHWDTQTLHFSDGVPRAEDPPSDAGEALWLQYYASTFNPARLKAQTMTRQMPRKYWHNLPEARLITPLVQHARSRTAAMLAADEGQSVPPDALETETHPERILVQLPTGRKALPR